MKDFQRFLLPYQKLLEPKAFLPQRVYIKEHNNEPSFFTVKIMDEESDIFRCTLGCNDGLIEINTEDYSYMSLTKEHLQILIELLDEVEDIERDDVEYKEWEKKKENKKYIDEL